MLQTVTQASTCTTVTSLTTASVFGQRVTFTAMVTASSFDNGGTVTFSDGSTSLGTASLSGGQATYSAPSSVIDTVTTHTITASYSGDTNFSGSSNSVLQTVSTASTSTTVSSSTAASVFGQSVTFTATVSPQVTGTFDNSGTVTFSDGSTSLGTASLSGGQATYSAPSSVIDTVTAHTIKASYSGDTNFTTSSGSVLQTVSQASTTMLVTSLTIASVYGQSVTFTATVTASSFDNSGTVTFSDGSTSIGTGLVTGGTTATFSTASLTAATHTITASYGGDNNFTGSASATVLQTVYQAHTTTSLVFSSNPSTTGQTVTFTVTVVANTPGSGIATGTITFKDGNMSIGTGLLDGASTATFTTSSLTQGNHQMSAVFAGDSNFFGSISPTLTQTVNIVSLRVSTCTPTATGFTAIFNRPLGLGTVSSPVLNLYDNSSCTLGPVDVTLVRASNGASIRGSLVVDAVAGRSGSDGATRITFIETGQSGVLGSAAPSTLFGVLPDGTYTVTLRSATNGFKDTNGNLLDGNGDGTPGDNFVTTFVVSNPANSVIVSLPDFARFRPGCQRAGRLDQRLADSSAQQ